MTLANQPPSPPPAPSFPQSPAPGLRGGADRTSAELARARAAVADIERQAGVTPSLVVQDGQPGGGQSNTSIRTSPDGRTTTINENGKVTTITTGEDGQVTIKSSAGTQTIAGPGSEAIRQLAEQQAQLAAQQAVAAATQPQFFPPRNPDDVPDGVVPLVGIIFGLVACTIIFFPLARAFARRMDRKAAPAAQDLTMRLDRIEGAIETMAVEMERVSEAQRYSARLLTERLPEMPTRAISAAESAR